MLIQWRPIGFGYCELCDIKGSLYGPVLTGVRVVVAYSICLGCRAQHWPHDLIEIVSIDEEAVAKHMRGRLRQVREWITKMGNILPTADQVLTFLKSA